MSRQFLVSFVLAIGVVSTGVWVANQSVNGSPVGRVSEVKAERSFITDETQASQKSDRQSLDNTVSLAQTASFSVSPSGISKCVVGGRTIYTDDGCPNGGTEHSIALYDSAGILSPPKENLAEIGAKRKEAERPYELPAQAQAQALSPSKSFRYECEDLDKRITNLDSMARQAHSGATQDVIKDERKALRDRQFAIRC